MTTAFDTQSVRSSPALASAYLDLIAARLAANKTRHGLENAIEALIDFLDWNDAADGLDTITIVEVSGA